MPAQVDTLRLAKAFEEAGPGSASAGELDDLLNAAIRTMTIRMGIMIGGNMLVLAVVIIGALIVAAR